MLRLLFFITKQMVLRLSCSMHQLFTVKKLSSNVSFQKIWFCSSRSFTDMIASSFMSELHFLLPSRWCFACGAQSNNNLHLKYSTTMAHSRNYDSLTGNYSQTLYWAIALWDCFSIPKRWCSPCGTQSTNNLDLTNPPSVSLSINNDSVS